MGNIFPLKKMIAPELNPWKGLSFSRELYVKDLLNGSAYFLRCHEVVPFVYTETDFLHIGNFFYVFSMWSHRYRNGFIEIKEMG